MQETILIDEEGTLQFAARLARACQTSCVIHLHGDLGAGKTTFSRGFIQALGHVGHVKSPTYTLVEPYQIGSWQVYHFDLYRLSSPDELEFMGIADYFTANSIALIEWPEKGQGILPAADIAITLIYHGDNRKLQLVANTTLGQTLLSKLEE
ncbi:MAG: tRNA (adenosine(37)-N6)-threonylcarbamoyltransferase complex ATPase subunit type 1 TsaE [Vibrionaceae bacterium]